MLQLRTHKYLDTYSNRYYYGQTPERLMCGDTTGIRLQNHRDYFRSPSSLLHADLPLHMNHINFERKYFCYDETAEGREEEIVTGIKDTLLTVFNNTADDDCIFITGYLAADTLENKDYVYPFIDTDIWKEFKGDSINSLFNKCVEQTSLRESERQCRDIKQHIRVFKSKTKHIILMLTDYADIDQESESFLALGLIPVFFEDWKERFDELEIAYFKCLVNRSQVKRISNVKPTTCFTNLEELEKYLVVEREIRYKTLFQKVATARINTIENQTRQLNNEMQRALSIYDESLKKLTEYNILIEKYREGTGEVVEELQTISKMKGVYDLNLTHNGQLRITLRLPLDYFDSDEAECAIRNVQDDNVKRFIEEIFIEQKYKLYIRTDAYYSYTPDAYFQDFTSIPEQDCRQINAMFNPHFQFYNCLGDYKPALVKAMREQDLTLFINVAIAAARSMNFKDGSVCNRWFSWLRNAFDSDNDFYLGIKCLEKDGKLYTLGQWLHNNFEEETPEINIIEAEDL